MARTTRKPPQNPIPISSNIAVEDPPADIHAPEPEPAAPQVPSEAKPPQSKIPTFLQTINKIPKADWGARANIYLYRVEPVIDRTRSGEPKFVNVYAEPVSEDRVMADYGSGRYKLILNFRKPGADTGDIIDSMWMDILNMQYPPKIALGEWTDDPRNKRWAWAKQALTPAAVPIAPPSIDPLAAFGTFMDIQDRIEERVKPASPPAPPVTTDPWEAAEKIMNMRSQNPMVDILRDELKEMRQEMRDSRKEAADREKALQDELRKAQVPTATPTKGIIEQLVDLGGESVKSRIVSSMFGNGAGVNGAADTVARAAKMGTLEFFAEIIPKVFESPLANAVAQKIVSSTENPAPTMQPGTTPSARVNGNATPASDPFQRFIGDVVTPVMLDYFKAEMGGEDFADWLYSGFPANFKRLQQFTHPMIPGLMGAQAIITAYKNTPEVWPLLAAHEARFISFVNDFCAWKPDTAQDVEATTIDLDAEPGEARPS